MTMKVLNDAEAFVTGRGKRSFDVRLGLETLISPPPLKVSGSHSSPLLVRAFW
jgi:hypothetical protein